MENENQDLFDRKPWTYKLGRDKTAIILHLRKPVLSIGGREYNKLLRVIALDNQYELQLFLDKIAKASPNTPV